MKFDTSDTYQKQKAKDYFYKLISNQNKIEVKKLQNKRTIRQNAYLHVCITLFAIEFGYTIEESKTLLKRDCNFMTYQKNNFKFLKRTRDMQTDELTKFIEWLRTYSSQKGCYIPTADEYIHNKIYIDNQIENNKEFL